MAASATLLELTPAEREAARARVPPKLAEIHVDPLPRPQLRWPKSDEPFSVLVVDTDDALHDQLREVFARESRHYFRPQPHDAAELALRQPFHLVLCNARLAFGPRGFLTQISDFDPLGVDRVLLMTHPEDARFVRAKLDRLGARCRILELPIDGAQLRREYVADDARMPLVPVVPAAPASSISKLAPRDRSRAR
jgi:hypothetical protein